MHQKKLSEISSRVHDILQRYSGQEITGISLEDELYHVEKGEKHSLVSTVYASEINTLIQDILDEVGIVIPDQDAPFLHTTLYTNLEYPNGIGIPNSTSFMNYNKGIIGN